MIEDNFKYIDIERTIADKGYDPRHLKSKSNKSVIAICPNCDVLRSIARSGVGSFCKKCSNKINGKDSWKKSRKIINTDEFLNGYKINIRKTIEILKNDPRTLTYGSEKKVITICSDCKKEKEMAFKDLLSRGITPCFGCARKKVSLSNKGNKHTDDAKKKMSKSRKGKLLSESHKASMRAVPRKKGKLSSAYGNPPPRGKGSWYIKKDGSRVWTRSTWEFKYAEYLDGLGILWELESTPYPVTYQFRGETKNSVYWPDFLVNGEWFEIKGWWRDDSKEKFEAFKEQYPNEKITLLMKPELLALGIDVK